LAKYDIYGVGSALVDTEVKVSNDFLTETGISKGLMTLVDRSHQLKILDRLNSQEMVQKCGGSACNSVVAAASLGATAFFSGRIGNDADGDLYIGDLNDLGISYHGERASEGATGQCLVMITPDAERTMNTCLGASEQLSFEDINTEALQQSEWLYIEGYLLTDQSRAEVIQRTVAFAKANSIKVALSLSDPFVVASCGDVIHSIIGDGIDLLFCNRDEAMAFTSADNIEDAADDIKRLSKGFAITDGASGALVFDGDDIFHSPGVKTLAVDTNGAGDMFAGAFLYAVVGGHGFHKAGELANYCAAQVVKMFGPRLESDQLVNVKREFGL
jgi:sugar/nucleoside kinase (ribokinase family)